MRNPATRIVFDLDGTLVQTRIASWEVFHEVQAEFGLGLDSPDKFFACFEGNFFESLRALVPDAGMADAVVARFFERLEQDYHPALIPGMTDVARALASRATLAVLSSNVTSVIRRILVENGLQFCFSHVFGGDVEPDKAAGLRRFVEDAAQGVGRRCAAPYDEGATDTTAVSSDMVLVTDTVGDVEAGIQAGVRVVGVSWGMHSPDQLRAAGAEFVAVWPQELVSYLQPDEGHGGEACSACELAGTFTACATSSTSVSLRTPGRGIRIMPERAEPPVPERSAAIRRARRTAAVALPPATAATTSCGCGPASPHAAEKTHGSDEMREAMRVLVGGTPPESSRP